jgi:hypothetical protein
MEDFARSDDAVKKTIAVENLASSKYDFAEDKTLRTSKATKKH